MSSQVCQSTDGRHRVFIIPLGDGRFRLVEKKKPKPNFVRPVTWPKETIPLPGVYDSIAAARAEIATWDGFQAGAS